MYNCFNRIYIVIKSPFSLIENLEIVQKVILFTHIIEHRAFPHEPSSNLTPFSFTSRYLGASPFSFFFSLNSSSGTTSASFRDLPQCQHLQPVRFRLLDPASGSATSRLLAGHSVTGCLLASYPPERSESTAVPPALPGSCNPSGHFAATCRGLQPLEVAPGFLVGFYRIGEDELLPPSSVPP